jgi:hypothetical protein
VNAIERDAKRLKLQKVEVLECRSKLAIASKTAAMPIGVSTFASPVIGRACHAAFRNGQVAS